MNIIYLPYSVPVSELPKCHLDGFNYRDYLPGNGFCNILVLSNDCLSIAKSDKEVLDCNERYQVIFVDPSNPEDMSNKVSECNIILSTLQAFEVRVGDDLEEFIPDYNQEYIIASHAKKSPKISMWAISLELSYRFGVKFFFHECADSKYVFHTGKVRTNAFNLLKSHKKEVEDVYSINLEFCKAPDKKTRVYDF